MGLFPHGDWIKGMGGYTDINFRKRVKNIDPASHNSRPHQTLRISYSCVLVIVAFRVVPL